jgi:Spy/CpxP family protein refolding chaperone
MKFLENTKITGLALLLLLALNSALLVVLIVQKPGPPPPRAHHPPNGRGIETGTADFFMHELNLDGQQRKEYEELIAGHRNEVTKLEEEIRGLREKMVGQLENETPDSNQIHELAAQVGSKQAQLEKATMDHFNALRDICTAEQQKEFSRVIREGLHRMKPGPPPPPR